MRRIVHLSDLHFGRHDPAIVTAAEDDIRGLRPDVVVVSGDLTQRARSAEFEQAARFLRDLPGAVVCVPGNHDIPLFNVARRLLSPFSAYHRWVGKAVPDGFLDDELAVLGVNTTLPFVWKGGRIGGSVVGAMQKWAKAADGRLRIVVAHHPFAPAAGGGGHGLVRGWRAAVGSMEAAGVDVVCTGHHHVAGHAETKAFTVGGPHRLLVVQAGTATSVRVRGEPNSYNVLDVTAEGIAVQVRSLDAGRFVPTAVQVFQRTARTVAANPTSNGPRP